MGFGNERGHQIYRLAGLAIVITLVGCGKGAAKANASFRPQRHVGWSSYGGDVGGMKYSALAQIHRGNVSQLQVAWILQTGDLSHKGDEDMEGPCGRCHRSESKFEATPILAGDRLYLSTPRNRVLALNPESGQRYWLFDPEIDINIDRNEGLVSRGVSYWEDTSSPSLKPCRSRIIFGTIDGELLALDAATGSLCPDFGVEGVVDLKADVGNVDEGQYGVTSPPAIIGDLVVVGSAIGDNRRIDLEHGTVRAYDARSGALRWSWDPIPRRPEHPGWNEWDPDAARRTGGANAWAPLSADPDRDLVFVPTGSAAPDFYGGERLGSNRFANSVVALRASTGEVIWDFQIVHHDIWDFDVPAQPALITILKNGRPVAAVAVATKMGHLFFLDRETGDPLFPVEERPVPRSLVPGEKPWPTQPFPVLPPPLHPVNLSSEDAWGLTPEDREACREEMQPLRNEGIFTPPSLEGTLMYPGYAGGSNWDGVAVDPERNLLVTKVLRFAMWVRLVSRDSGATWGNQRGTPYHMERGMLVSPSGLPCNPPPWGLLVAVDLETGKVAWERPLGRMPQLSEVPGSDRWGSLAIGGPIVTAGGLVFIAATMDDAIRAFDIETGEELWMAPLPAGGQATPMTYQVHGKQYVVIAAGGYGTIGTTPGDYVVAFALP